MSRKSRRGNFPARNNGEAIRLFDLAEDRFADFEGRNKALDTTVSMMSGDYAFPYAGEGQDRVFTCLYKAIDFGVLGKPAAVRTELNRAMLHQQNWRAERSAEIAAADEKMGLDARNYAQANGARQATGSNEVSMVSQAFGDASFSAALRTNAGFDTARDGRLDLLTDDDFTNAYLVRVNETFRRYVGDSGPKPHDMVTVFVEDGMCPKREEWRIDLPTVLIPWVNRYVQYAGMALPKLAYRNAAVTSYSVSGAGTVYPMDGGRRPSCENRIRRVFPRGTDA